MTNESEGTVKDKNNEKAVGINFDTNASDIANDEAKEKEADLVNNKTSTAKESASGGIDVVF